MEVVIPNRTTDAVELHEIIDRTCVSDLQASVSKKIRLDTFI